jgi:proteic killer suppression protein
MLDMLDFAIRPEELILDGFRTHQLSGDMDGFWSMRVNGSWRLTYRFVGEDIEHVDYRDYH